MIEVTQLHYVATPYSRYPGGIEQAFIAASKLAGQLLFAGINCYSPIAHSHSLALFAGLDPLKHEIWMPFDEIMMARCDVLLVAHLDGWQESVGVAHEVAFFEAAGKPIFDLDPKTLLMTLRPQWRSDESIPLAHNKTRSMHAGASE